MKGYAVSGNQTCSAAECVRQVLIEPMHPIIDLGDGKRVTTICDREGNTIRLIQIEGM
jgi:hypothetical protein